MLKYHWIEESQHTKTDALEIAQMASTMSPDELIELFDQVQSLAELVDETFVGQVEQEMETLQAVTGRKPTDPEAMILRE